MGACGLPLDPDYAGRGGPARRVLGFEQLLAERAESLVEDSGKKIASTDGAVHADETYWTLDAHRAYYWVHATEFYVHFTFDTSRAGEVSRKLLGPYFDGILVTDYRLALTRLRA